jgi:hypothetical protein
MTHSLLDVGDHLPGIGLIPAAIEVLGGDPELNYEIAGQVLRLDLSPLLPPKPEESTLIIAHDDPGIRAADEVATVFRLLRRHEDLLHLEKIPYRKTSSLLRSRARMRKIFQGAQTMRITAVAKAAVMM